MIKAVFFDFYNTIITFNPSREELQARACLDYGIEVDTRSLRRSYWVADDFMTRENACLSIQSRSQQEAQQFWADYESVILREAGIDVSRELALKIFTRLRQLDRNLVLFDDVLPTMDILKKRNLFIGLISNLSRSLENYCVELGIKPYVDFALSSSEAGSEKPHPGIFLSAIEHAGVDAGEAIHIGDQYFSDVVGARGTGMTPLLLDRDGFWAEIDDCPRIRSLIEVADYL